MNQFVVPQFLDVEDKIIGPITVRQFIEMIVAAGLCFIFYKLFDFALFVLLSLMTAGAILVVAFVKINGQSFHFFLLNFITTWRSPKLKVWKKDVNASDIKYLREQPEIAAVRTVRMRRQPVTASKLSEIALIVDTGGVYQGENGL